MRTCLKLAVLFGPCVCAGEAFAKTPADIGYFLPKVRVTAGVDQKLVQCPPTASAQASGDASTKLAFKYKSAIASKAVPDRLVTIDATSGFLADRATSIKLTEDGLIKEFNGTTTGQGGPLLVSLIKAGAVAFSLTAGPLPPAAAAVAGTAAIARSAHAPAATPPRRVTAYYLQCTEAARKLLTDLERLNADIAALEALIVTGRDGASTQQLLERRRAEAVAVEADLTQTVKLPKPLVPTLQVDGSFADVAGLLPGPDFSEWVEVAAVTRVIDRDAEFVERPRPTLEAALRASSSEVIPGQFGYQLEIDPDDRIADWLGCGDQPGRIACASDDTAQSGVATRNLVYRRPVPASARLSPLSAPCAATPCPAAPEGWKAAGQASASESVKLPQLSRLFTLPTGGGGIFGSRTVAAEFGASGEPVSLKYERGSAGKDLAGVIDASAGAAQTMDGARLAATKAKIEEIEAAEKLAGLIEGDLDEPE